MRESHSLRPCSHFAAERGPELIPELFCHTVHTVAVGQVCGSSPCIGTEDMPKASHTLVHSLVSGNKILLQADLGASPVILAY